MLESHLCCFPDKRPTVPHPSLLLTWSAATIAAAARSRGPGEIEVLETSGGLVTDEVTWWALELIHGIDMPDLDGIFLHDDDQVEQWLEEFRHRCRVLPVRDGT